MTQRSIQHKNITVMTVQLVFVLLCLLSNMQITPCSLILSSISWYILPVSQYQNKFIAHYISHNCQIESFSIHLFEVFVQVASYLVWTTTSYNFYFTTLQIHVINSTHSDNFINVATIIREYILFRNVPFIVYFWYLIKLVV